MWLRWSDGRKSPPPALEQLREHLEKHSLSPSALLKIPPLSNATYEAYQKRMKELNANLAQKIELPEGKQARVGDILAVQSYQRMSEL